MDVRNLTSIDEPTDSSLLSHPDLIQSVKAGGGCTDLGLYIHIPFCRKRCHFCAFYLTVHREDQVCQFLHALEAEIAVWGRGLGNPRVSTVYLGGGTPTSLTPKQLEKIFDAVAKEFHLVPKVEVTVEASPDTVSWSGLKVLHQAGVNRLSLGAQSFDESEWNHLGRSGNILAIRTAIELARKAGLDNINLDLMFGLPDQTLESWQYSLSEVVALNPTHVSCYALTLEEGTRFYEAHRRGEISVGDVDLENTMCRDALSHLTEAGYRQYEISNYCRPGYECRHNFRYWTNQEYLGLGPSAQSYIGSVRFGNVENLTEYCRRLRQHELPLAAVELLSKQQVIRERVVFGLRLIKGLDLEVVEELVRDHHSQLVVQQLIKDDLLCHEKGTLRFTQKGRQFADSVAVQLM